MRTLVDDCWAVGLRVQRVAVLRRVALLVVGLLIGGLAHAETIPATATTGSVTANLFRVGGYWQTAATKEGVCSLIVASGGFWQASSSGYGYGECRYPFGALGYVEAFGCPAGTTASGSGSTFACTGTTYSCPATGGWTKTGTNCTRADCAAGETRQSDGSCLTNCAKGPNEEVGGQRYAFPYPQPSGVIHCVEHCTVYPCGQGTIDGAVRYSYACVNGAGLAASNCVGGGTVAPSSTGADGVPTNNPTANDCINAGMKFGKVGSTVVCHDEAKTVDTKRTLDVKTPASGSGGETKETSKETVCEGERCVTTSSTKTISGGSGAGGTGAGSSSTAGDTLSRAEDRDDFCASNPTDKLCRGEQAGTPASTDGLYTKGTRTVGQAFADFKASVSSAPFYSAAAGYFSAGSIPGGSCEGLVADVSVMGHAFHVDAGQVLCGSAASSMYTVLGIGMMLVAGWVAFRIAIL